MRSGERIPALVGVEVLTKRTIAVQHHARFHQDSDLVFPHDGRQTPDGSIPGGPRPRQDLTRALAAVLRVANRCYSRHRAGRTDRGTSRSVSDSGALRSNASPIVVAACHNDSPAGGRVAVITVPAPAAPAAPA